MSDRFELIQTGIPGLNVFQRKPIGDARGYVERMFCTGELAELLAGRAIVQVNRTCTARRGTVRGLHFQHAPHAETKFVSCLHGEVFDVAVDMRRDSPTFLNWHAEVLSAGNHRTMVVPEGFAHGFQCLADDCELLYFHSAAYRPDAEGGLNAQDPRLAIAWPLPVEGLSQRDASHPMLASDFAGWAS